MKLGHGILSGIFSTFFFTFVSVADSSKPIKPVEVKPASAPLEVKPAPQAFSYSRWALSAEFVSGGQNILHQSNPFIVQDVHVVLGAAVGVYFYLFDQCQLPNLKTCVALPLFAKVSTVHSIDIPQSQVNVALGLEPVFFFGTQRIVGITFSGTFGYRYTVARNPSNYGINPHAFFLQMGTGLLFNLQSAAKGLEIYLRLEYDIAQFVTIPIGVRYRF